MQVFRDVKQRLVLIGASLLKALAPGERWLTVHPNGRDDKGVHVLVQVQKDGSAKVIGGAGGALNHLRLTGVRSEAQYREEAAQRAQEHRAREAVVTCPPFCYHSKREFPVFMVWG